MADDNTQDTTTTTTTEQPGTQPVEKTPRLFTQDEVNRIVANRLADSKREPKPEVKTTEADDVKVTKRDLMARIEAMEAAHAREKSRLAFEKSAAKHGLDDEAIELLFAAHEAAKPSDSKAWLDSKVGLFGKKTQPTNPEQTNQVADTRSPAVAPNAPTKVNPLNTGAPVNLFQLSEDQLAKIDPEEIRNQFEGMVGKSLQNLGGPRPRIKRQ